VQQNGVGYFEADDALLRVRPERSEEVVSGLRPDRREEALTGAGFGREEGRGSETSEASVDTLWRWPQEDRAFHSFTLAPDGDVLLRSRSALLRFPPATPFPGTPPTAEARWRS